MNDNELIQNFLQGDNDAFSSLVNKYEKYVFSIAFSVSQNREDARDISQDTFLKAFLSLRSFKGKSSFSTWLYSLAKNTACDYLRKRKNTVSLDSDSFPDLPSSSLSPFSLILQKEVGKEVRKEIKNLSKNQRDVVILREYCDYSYKEISKILNINVQTVKTRLFRGKEKLKEKLEGIAKD